MSNKFKVHDRVKIKVDYHGDDVFVHKGAEGIVIMDVGYHAYHVDFSGWVVCLWGRDLEKIKNARRSLRDRRR